MMRLENRYKWLEITWNQRNPVKFVDSSLINGFDFEAISTDEISLFPLDHYCIKKTTLSSIRNFIKPRITNQSTYIQPN